MEMRRKKKDLRVIVQDDLLPENTITIKITKLKMAFIYVDG